MLTVAHTAKRADFTQALDVGHNLSGEIALKFDSSLFDFLTDEINFILA